MSPRNSKANQTPVTRPLNSARVSSKALSRSAQVKSAPGVSNSVIIPSPAKPARGSKGSAHIVSFADAKRGATNKMKSSASRYMPFHEGDAQIEQSDLPRGKHVSMDLDAARDPHMGAHASIDLTKQAKSGKKKGLKSLKDKMKMQGPPFGKKGGKEFVIPSGKDMTTQSSNIFGSMLDHLSADGAERSKKAAMRMAGAAGDMAFPLEAAEEPEELQPVQEIQQASKHEVGAKKKSAQKASKKGAPKVAQAAAPKAQGAVQKASAANEVPQKTEKKASKNPITGFFDNRKEKAANKKRQKAKAKANKKFDKAYGGTEKAATAAASGQGSPRAALYSTKMGTKHKKSAKMQIKDARDMATQSMGLIGDKVSGFKIPEIPKYVSRLMIVAAVLAVFGFGLYAPAQQYYVQMRETDRLHAEYVEVADRTNNLAASIDSLHTKEGIEDKAHADLGYVKNGEKSATVKGIAQINLLDLPTSNVAPGSIPAPDTWYSGFLDVLFGYSG